MFLSGLALVAMSLFSGCQKEMVDEGPNTPNTRPLTVQEQKTVTSSNDFAFRSFAELSKADAGENIFISPLSISMALTMTYNGADGETKQAIGQTLGFEAASDEDINKSYKDLVALLQGIDKKVIFTSANSLWHSNLVRLQAPFVQLNKDYFNATVRGLDFDSPGAVGEINNWVKNNTNNKIDKILDEIKRGQVLFLINAIYFKGTWTHPFDKNLTKPGQFRLENGSSVTHDFMTMKKGGYLYYSDNNVEMIDLPYGNEQYSMTIVLPGGDKNLGQLIPELNAANLDNWLANSTKRTWDLHMPKFKLEYEEVLNEMLSKLGMGVAFTGGANFSRMLEGQSNMAISQVKHKTFVEVNEEGTEAAAVTSVGIEVTSLPPSVRIDRPFVFMIREKSSGAILFIGKLMQPE